MAKKTFNVHFLQPDIKIKSEGDVAPAFLDILIQSHEEEHRLLKRDDVVFIKYLDDVRDGYVTGLFQKDKLSGHPPVHDLSTDQFQKLDLQKDQALAYGNVFLYNPQLNVLLVEQSKNSVANGQIAEFLNAFIYKRHKDTDPNKQKWPLCSITLPIMVYLQTRERLAGIKDFKEVIIDIAFPQGIANEIVSRDKAIEQIAATGSDWNANRAQITLKATHKGNVLNKSRVARFLSTMLEIIGENQGGNFNKVSVSGTPIDGATNDEEIVNLISDRMVDTIELDQPPVLSNLMYTERKREIVRVYQKNYGDLANH